MNSIFTVPLDVRRPRSGVLRAVGRLGLALVLACAAPAVAMAAGDLSRQTPVEVTVELGTAAGDLKFVPSSVEVETGKLYKLILKNPSPNRHYFSAPMLGSRVFTRKVQVFGKEGGKDAIAEIYGGITRVEVAPGATAEWWFVPVATGTVAFQCNSGKAGEKNADKGMIGQIVIK
ncbi:MAG: hypothetical protein SH859_11580 [Hyphomicrobium aestuarii]|nr:hypothetical protein [Hyphomicrobium aestuarii]